MPEDKSWLWRTSEAQRRHEEIHNYRCSFTSQIANGNDYRRFQRMFGRKLPHNRRPFLRIADRFLSPFKGEARAGRHHLHLTS